MAKRRAGLLLLGAAAGVAGYCDPLSGPAELHPDVGCGSARGEGWRYFLSSGQVILRGVVSGCTSDEAPLFRLPAGCRPPGGYNATVAVDDASEAVATVYFDADAEWWPTRTPSRAAWEGLAPSPGLTRSTAVE